ncbi:MAG: HNH endonuclease [Nitrosotalea sp.]
MSLEEQMKHAFVSILTKGKKDNTYKFALARYLLDYSSRPTECLEIPYGDIASSFLKYYWHQECKFRIRQNFHKEKPPSVIKIIREEFGTKYIPDSFKEIPADIIKRAEKKILAKVFGSEEQKTSQVVPRFQNISVGSKVKRNQIFYDYNDSRQVILLKPKALEFFRQNYVVLLKGVILEWAKFLEKVNTLPRLIAKIESAEMMRHSLRKYVLLFRDSDHCFYCNSRLQRGDIHVDHFIPWSYIFDDEAWNLVLSCSKCNLKKRDSLAQEDFLRELIKRNSSYYEKISALKKSLDDLDSGKGWEAEMRHNYSNCLDYGFTIARLP